MILFAPTAILLILYLLKADNICGIDLEKIDFYFAILAALIFLVISSLIVVITFSLLTAGAVSIRYKMCACVKKKCKLIENILGLWIFNYDYVCN